MANANPTVELWWSQLSPEDQEAVRQVREGQPLPAHLVVSLGKVGIIAAGAQWVGQQQGYDFQLPRVVQEFLDQQD